MYENRSPLGAPLCLGMTRVHHILLVLEPTGHAADEDLERYSQGGIAEEECARLEEHLLVCESCRGRLEEHDRFAGSMALAGEQWRAEHPPKETKSRRLPPLLFAFASIVLLTLGALWLTRKSGQELPPVAVALSATRGVTGAAQAPAGRPLELKPDLTGLASFPNYDLQVVDSAGAQIARGKAAPDGTTQIPALRPGTYFVRIYSPERELLREYALQLQ
jgi:hypothetical protein